jgi:hypothetical protein
MRILKSKRSGGPKTAEGKLAVANNALKTRSHSLKTILPGESEQDFKQLQDQGIMRTHEDLQRSFYKALNELRRQQTWRSQTIDVNEEAS